MQTGKFLTSLYYPAMLHYLIALLRLMGVAFSVPVCVALVADEFLYSIIFFVLMALCLLGGYFSRYRDYELEIRESLIVVAISYLLFAFISTFPFLLSHSFIDSFFECMSGITTTGLSVMDPKDLPMSLLFFRSYLQWLGGAGIIVFSLLLFFQPGKTFFNLCISEYGRENLLGSIFLTAQRVISVYLLLTGIGFLVFMGAGMSPFDALLHIMATVSTGGFSPHQESIAFYGQRNSMMIELSLMLFMILSAVSFPLYSKSLHQGVSCFFYDLQVRILSLLIVSGFVLFFSISNWTPAQFMNSLFHAISTVTTTGFSSINPVAWEDGSKFWSSILMVIGGSSGSSAGGIKIFRFIILCKMVAWMINRMLLPQEAVIQIKYGHEVVSSDQIKQICAFFFALLILLISSTTILLFENFSLADSLFESASALGTVGLSTGISSEELSVIGKLALIFDMWAGRVEIIPVLVLFSPAFGLIKRKHS